MSTYVISDIHGQLDALKALLSMISFNYKSDTLYLLGDYVDWGPKSIETVLFIKELIDKHDNIIALMGNHDLMMYNVVKLVKETYSINEAIEVSNRVDYGCWTMNGGDVTLTSYMSQTKEVRDNIKQFVANLPYFKITEPINGQVYYLCHSKPYVNGMELVDIVWDRIRDGILPRSFMDRDDKAILVSGHTIVSNYRSIDDDWNLKIYKSPNNRYINIDCGGKLIGMRDGYRLAALKKD